MGAIPRLAERFAEGTPWGRPSGEGVLRHGILSHPTLDGRVFNEDLEDPTGTLK